MARISRSALVLYTPEQMYNLVSDIESYAEFLPSCAGAQIDRQEGDQLEATLEIAKMGLRHSFSTRNTMVPGQSIEIKLLKGPFRHLVGLWTFQAVGAEGCRISFELEFEMSNKLTQATLGPLVGQMMNTMVDAFSNRAKQVYG